MIVLDASIVVEILIGGPLADSIMRDLGERGEALIVPHLLDIEVLSALRGLITGRRLDSHRGTQLLEDLSILPATRCDHHPLIGRIWELRHNFTAYDAVYIALAEATNSVLYTCDEKLRTGHRAKVAVFIST